MQVNGDVGLGDDDDDGGGVGDDSDEGLDSTLASIRQRRHNQILSNQIIFQEDGKSRHQPMIMEGNVTGRVGTIGLSYKDKKNT